MNGTYRMVRQINQEQKYITIILIKQNKMYL